MSIDTDKFKREERYIVIKRKHLDAIIKTTDFGLPDDERLIPLQSLLDDINAHCGKVNDCVVVESDWPEYETAYRFPPLL